MARMYPLGGSTQLQCCYMLVGFNTVAALFVKGWIFWFLKQTPEKSGIFQKPKLYLCCRQTTG